MPRPTRVRAYLAVLAALAGSAFALSAPLPANPFFVANEGQWEEPFEFKCSIGAATYFLTNSGMTIDLRSDLPPTSVGGQGGSLSGLPPLRGG
jgi:hypothetical protein